MKIALVGIGKIAVDQHVHAIFGSEQWSLGATVSRQGAIENIKSYKDFDLLLAERSDIRVISFCLPPVPRFDYAVKALKSGRHVMLEKPPGATLSECHALIALAQKLRLSLYATWHSREADKVTVAKKWLVDKRLESLKVTWKEDVRRWHPNQNWIWEPGGMGVFDPGINALSIVTEILPVNIHLSDAVLLVPENRQTPIAADLKFYHPDGAAVTATFDWRQKGEQIWTIEAVTDQGTLMLLDGGARIMVDGHKYVLEDDNLLSGEYPRLYAKMAALVAAGGIDMDMRPMVHVSDALSLGRRQSVAPFFD